MVSNIHGGRQGDDGDSSSGAVGTGGYRGDCPPPPDFEDNLTLFKSERAN